MEGIESDTKLLLQQWNQGDPESLSKLLDRHLPWIQAHIRTRMGDFLREKGETADYVQDAVVQFLRYGPKALISNENHFRALMVLIAENTLRNKADWFSARQREVCRERPLPTDTVLVLDPPRTEEDTPSHLAARHEEEAWVRLGLELIDPPDREVIVLRQWDDLSFSQIGERLGISSEAAHKRHGRAMSRLSKKVGELRRRRMDCILEQLKHAAG